MNNPTPPPFPNPPPLPPPIQYRAPTSTRNTSWSPGVAVILALLIPGLGQVYKGQFGEGAIFFFSCFTLMVISFILPPFFLIALAFQCFSVYLAATEEPGDRNP